MDDKITHVVSFSGGRSSAYMSYVLMRDYSHLKMAFVFANTGKELEETLVFVEKCSIEFGLNVTWIEPVLSQEKGIGVRYKIVEFKTASRKGEPFTEMVQKFGVPNKDAPFCTRELKERAILRWSNDNFGKNYVAVEGVRIDEPTRINANKVYPLAHWFPTWEIQIRLFWAGWNFDLNLKDYEGNCDLCWKKSLRKRLTILKEHPERAQQWIEWEEMDADGNVFDRDGFTIAQLLEMSKQPFMQAIDKLERHLTTPQLFEIDLDRESKCSCN